MIGSLRPEQLLSEKCLLFDLDCRTALPAAARQHRCDFQVAIRSEGNFHGLALWFDCELLPGVSFTTGPEGTGTHWEQTLLFVDPASAVHD